MYVLPLDSSFPQCFSRTFLANNAGGAPMSFAIFSKIPTGSPFCTASM